MKSNMFAWALTVLFLMPVVTMAQTEEIKVKQKKTAEIKIQTNLHCGSCKEKIETDLAAVKGVKEAIADVDTKVVTVKFSPKKTSADVIIERIQKLGYQAKTMGGGCCPGGTQSTGGCQGAGKSETGGCKGNGSGSGSGCGGKH